MSSRKGTFNITNITFKSIFDVYLVLVKVGSVITSSQHGAVVLFRTIGRVVHIVAVKYTY